MAGTRRHGINAAIYADLSVGGTVPATAAGTAGGAGGTLTLLTSRGSWSLEQDRDFVDTTSFGDSSKTSVIGLGGSSGDIAGFLDFGDNNVWKLVDATTERALLIFPDVSNNSTTYWQSKSFFSPKYAGSTTSAVSQDLTFNAGPSGGSWVHP